MDLVILALKQAKTTQIEQLNLHLPKSWQELEKKIHSAKNS